MPPELIVLLIGVILMALVLGLLIFYLLRQRIIVEAKRQAAISRDMIVVSQRRPGHPLRFEIEGQTYRTIAEIENEQHLRFLLTLAHMLNEQIPHEIWERLLGVTPPQEPPRPSPTPPSAKSEPKANAPRLDGVVTAHSPSPTSTPLELAEQIDVFLQELLLALPNPPDMSLSTARDGRMRIWYEGHAYHTIEQVPDVEAQTLIRQAIRRWEEANKR